MIILIRKITQLIIMTISIITVITYNNNDNNNNDKFLPYRIKNIWRLIDGIILIKS